MVKRLRECQAELTEYEYALLVNMVLQDIKYHSTIGTSYRDKQVIELINNTLPIVKRLGY